MDLLTAGAAACLSFVERCSSPRLRRLTLSKAPLVTAGGVRPKSSCLRRSQSGSKPTSIPIPVAWEGDQAFGLKIRHV